MNHMSIDAHTVYCVGDIHGEYGGISMMMRRYELQDACLVFCGDIGLGFNSEAYYQQTFSKLNRECKKRNVTLIFIRGNHDDPAYFSEQKINYSHIHSVADYTVLTIAGHNILCVGGGISMDRLYRQSKMLAMAQKYARFHGCSLGEARIEAPKLYWEDEPPVYDEMSLSEIRGSEIKIDTVCTHTCPSFSVPHTKDGIESWLAMDGNLEKDIDAERATMDKLYHRLLADGHPLKNWCYGHFHYHHVAEIDGITFRLLDMCYHSVNYDVVALTPEE